MMLSSFSDITDFTSKLTLEKFAISLDEKISYIKVLCTTVRVLCTTVLSKLTAQQEFSEFPVIY